MSSPPEAYINEITDDVSACLKSMGCQPILFIGSGLSKRYFGAPNWDELLQRMAEQCPAIKMEYGYYKQAQGHLIDVGEVFAGFYREWAWAEGRSNFDASLFHPSKSPDIYLKNKVCELFESLTPASASDVTEPNLKTEIDALVRIRPHSIITTNYDRFLEKILPDYEPVIGQQVLHSNHISIGEIFKIHGCASVPESLVLTRKDYNEFIAKKKYLSSKLFTFFAEHPLLLVGYAAQDHNITSILSDIDELLGPENQLIPNIYILEWKETFPEESPPRERLISVGDGRSVRIKSITASSFEWVFNAFGINDVLERVNPKLLRGLLARTYDLIRRDIPLRFVEVDYQALEHTLNSQIDFAKLYGITTLNSPTALNATWPYSLTTVGNKLGYRGWQAANFLLDRVRLEKGIDLKASDNKYHIAIMNGTKLQTHKYSDLMVDLLTLVRDGKVYEVEL